MLLLIVVFPSPCVPWLAPPTRPQCNRTLTFFHQQISVPSLFDHATLKEKLQRNIKMKLALANYTLLVSKVMKLFIH